MDSDDDFVVGDDGASSVASMRTPSPRGKLHKLHERLLTAIDHDELCYICTQPVTDCSPQDLTAQLGVRQVCHKSCYNGAHTLQRVCQTLSTTSSPQALEELRNLKASDLPTWRTLCMSLVASGTDRTPAMRQKARSFITELVATSRVMRRNRRLLCTKAQHIAWYAMNEGMSQASAATKWEQDLKNPSVHKERKADGTIVVAVELPTEIIADEEIAKRRRLEVAHQGLDQDEFENCYARLQRKEPEKIAAQFLPPGAAAMQPGAASTSASSTTAPPDSPTLPATPEAVQQFLGALGGEGFGALVGAHAAAHPARRPRWAAGLLQQLQQPEPHEQGQAPIEGTLIEVDDSAKSLSLSGPSGGGGADDEEDTLVTTLTISGRAVATMPQFLSFKKQLKDKMKLELKRYESSNRGKNIAQLLGTYLEQEELKNDEEVKGLDAEAAIDRVIARHGKLKDLAEKKIALWKFQVTRTEQWGQTLDEVDKLVADWGEAVDEVKQITDIVRDVRLGLQKSKVQQKRQNTYKRSKYATACNSQGFPEEVAKAFSQCFCEWLERDRNSGSDQAAANPNPLDGAEVLDLTVQDAELNIYVAKLAAAVDDTACQQALTLQGQMRSNTIMKPIALPDFEDGAVKALNSLTLVETVDHVMHKPWLILSNSFSFNWGPLRWPCAGFPAILIPLDDVAIVGTIRMEKVVSKGLSLANMDSWFGDDEGKQITTKDLDVVILEKGQAMKLHLGTICLWTFAPANGNVEAKSEKAPKGKCLVQWLLSKEPDMSDAPLAANEIKHEWTRLVTGYGTSKPWSAMKDGVQAYVDSIKVSE